MFRFINLYLFILLFIFADLLNAQMPQDLKSPRILPELASGSWVLLDYDSGWVLAEKNSEQPVEPASLTKLMMNYVLFSKLSENAISLQDKVKISEKAWRVEGSRMFAKVGSEVVLEQLLRSTIIQSGNDASIALAEHVAGSEESFVLLMNKAAAVLGLNSTHFVNVTGLPSEQHYSSAYDIALLSAAIIKQFPQYYAWYKEKEYTHNNITQYNRNKLLWRDKSVDGLKTGHTSSAGFCLAGSALRNGMRLIAVVTGAQSEQQRADDVLVLLNYGFAAYESVELVNTNQDAVNARVYKGDVDTVKLSVQQTVRVPVPVGSAGKISKQKDMHFYYHAPVNKGEKMGLVTVQFDGNTILDVPLVAMDTVKKGTWFSQLKDELKLWFVKIISA